MELLGNNRVWIIFLDSISFLWAFLFLHGLYEPSKISSDLKKTTGVGSWCMSNTFIKTFNSISTAFRMFSKFFRELK